MAMYHSSSSVFMTTKTLIRGEKHCERTKAESHKMDKMFFSPSLHTA